jgi:hypothetical protein
MNVTMGLNTVKLVLEDVGLGMSWLPWEYVVEAKEKDYIP